VLSKLFRFAEDFCKNKNYELDHEKFVEAHEMMINEIRRQEHYAGNLFRIVDLVAQYFHSAFLGGDPSATVNALFYHPTSNEELEIKAWHKEVDFQNLKFLKTQIYPATVA